MMTIFKAELTNHYRMVQLEFNNRPFVKHRTDNRPDRDDVQQCRHVHNGLSGKTLAPGIITMAGGTGKG